MECFGMTMRPILFSAPMVIAILDGTKTQTRRVMKPQPDEGSRIDVGEMGASLGIAYIRSDRGGQCVRVPCPYGRHGDLLWVRESIKRGYCGNMDMSHYVADGYPTVADAWPWKRNNLPSIFCPLGLSRITLKITGVRVERLQDISEADALEEGITYNDLPSNGLDPMKARHWYRRLWDSINGHGSWDLNPWVWVIEFVIVE